MGNKFLKMAKPLIINFSKQNSYKQIAESGDKLLILENWNRLGSGNNKIR